MNKPSLALFACLLVATISAQIPNAGNVLWLKADNGVFKNNSGDPALNGELVEVWEDQSGSGNHFLQDILTQRPRLVMQANYLCSQPVLRFEIERRTFLYSRMRLGGSKTIFMVFVSPSLVNNSETLLSIKSPSGTFTEILCTDILSYRPISFMCEAPASASGSVFVNAVGTNVAFNSNGNIFGMTFNGGACSSTTSYSTQFDAGTAPVASSGLFGRFTGDSTTIGARAPQQNYSFLSGDIAEIIAYDRVLNSIEINEVQQYLVTKYGFFGTCTPLTFQLIGFNAILNNSNTVSLNWEINQSPDSTLWRVERSHNGLDWSALNSGIIANNNFFESIDRQPHTGINYYRLSASRTGFPNYYSPIKKIILPPKEFELDIYPNPSTGIVNIVCQGNEKLTMTVYDILGKMVLKQPVHCGILDLSELNPGIYHIMLRGNLIERTFRFIKQ